jgi:hypothetical protein
MYLTEEGGEEGGELSSPDTYKILKILIMCHLLFVKPSIWCPFQYFAQQLKVSNMIIRWLFCCCSMSTTKTLSEKCSDI